MNNAVFLDQKAYDRIAKDVTKFLVVTVAELVNKFKVNGSVARKLLRDLSSKNLIKQVGEHHAGFTLYTGVASKVAEKAPEKGAKGAAAAKEAAAAAEKPAAAKEVAAEKAPEGKKQ